MPESPERAILRKLVKRWDDGEMRAADESFFRVMDAARVRLALTPKQRRAEAECEFEAAYQAIINATYADGERPLEPIARAIWLASRGLA